MIDIIIPSYNAHETIDRCISSIVSQVERDIKVTIVNDAGEDYHKTIERYKNVLDIREISYEKNGGPGFARQYGYDNTKEEFVTFIDADDTFYTPFSIKSLLLGINMDNGYASCIGNFVEENRGNFIPHKNDMIWMFGKLYRRSFIDKYNIRFCPGSRWNEDNGWNSCMRLCANEIEKINFIQDTVYCWHERPNSITRIDNCRYSFDKSFVGYAENMLYSVKHGRRYAPFNGGVDHWAIKCLMSLYEYYIESYERDKRFLRQAWAWCQEYYDQIIRSIEYKMTENTIKGIYSEVMKDAYARGSMNNVIPCMSIGDFLISLRNHQSPEFFKEDISDYFPEDSIYLKGEDKNEKK